MIIGIVGLSSSGKSTLFAAFVGQEKDAAASKSLERIVNVPDPRLDRLSEHFKPKKTIYTTVRFEDCLPLNTPIKQDRIKLYDKMKTMDAFVCVVGAYRCANRDEILKETEKIRFEMIMLDLGLVTGRVEKIDREIKLAPRDRALKENEVEVLKKLQVELEDERFLYKLDLGEIERKLLTTYNLLTLKPCCFVLNIPETIDKKSEDNLVMDIRNLLKEKGDDSPVLAVNALLESDMAKLDPGEIREFMEGFGISSPGRDRVIKTAYQMLDLITFFTMNENEIRAWNLRRGGTALDAAATVHSDLARGFIRAEIIDYETLLELGSMAESRKAGKLRQEGKTCIVRDGEMVHILFHV